DRLPLGTEVGGVSLQAQLLMDQGAGGKEQIEGAPGQQQVPAAPAADQGAGRLRPGWMPRCSDGPAHYRQARRQGQGTAVTDDRAMPLRPAGTGPPPGGCGSGTMGPTCPELVKMPLSPLRPTAAALVLGSLVLSGCAP